MKGTAVSRSILAMLVALIAGGPALAKLTSEEFDKQLKEPRRRRIQHPRGGEQDPTTQIGIRKLATDGLIPGGH